MILWGINLLEAKSSYFMQFGCPWKKLLKHTQVHVYIETKKRSKQTFNSETSDSRDKIIPWKQEIVDNQHAHCWQQKRRSWPNVKTKNRRSNNRKTESAFLFTLLWYCAFQERKHSSSRICLIFLRRKDCDLVFVHLNVINDHIRIWRILWLGQPIALLYRHPSCFHLNTWTTSEKLPSKLLWNLQDISTEMWIKRWFKIQFSFFM